MVSEHLTGVIEHKKHVGTYLNMVCSNLIQRAVEHDNSKFSPEEFELFEQVTPQLKTLAYGSEEYKESLRSIKPAIAHHYKANRHHPEYHDHGISDMSLLDVIEMVCDWIAAVKRTKDGDILKSLDINKDRFEIDDQLFAVIKNTVLHLLPN